MCLILRTFEHELQSLSGILFLKPGGSMAAIIAMEYDRSALEFSPDDPFSLLGYYFTRASEIAVGVCTADPKCVHAVGLLRGVHMKVALVPLTFSTWCGAVDVVRGGPPMSTPKPEGVRTASTASSAEGDRQGSL